MVMEIEAIKTWQWMAIGLFAGFLLSCVLVWRGPVFDTQNRDTMQQGEFENSTLVSTKYGRLVGDQARLVGQYHKAQPLLRDVTIHPPLPSDEKHYWVTGRVYFIGLKLVDDSKPRGPMQVYEQWRLFKYPASIPYKPGYQVRADKRLDKNAASRRNVELADLKKALGGQGSFPTVLEFVKAVSQLPDNDIKYEYAWWELPVPEWTLPPVAGLLIIGIAWPMALAAMQNYGLAQRPASKAKPKPEPAKKPQRPVIGATPAGVVIKPAAPPPPPPPPLPGDRKEYGGVYYPVVKTTHKE
jgi:hypothetical protein